MSRNDPGGVLAALAEKLSVNGLLEDYPDLTREKLKEILLEASRKFPSKTDARASRDFNPGKALIINVDGASRGNPGEAGAGAVLRNTSGQALELKKYLGQTTNNVAEYEALIMALEEASRLGVREAEVRSDSELLVHQMNGVYRVKSPQLKPLYEKAVSLASGFGKMKFVHVGREDNREADRLANLAVEAKAAH